MQRTGAHPSDAQLQALAAKSLDPPAMVTIQDHVKACPDCLNRYQAFRPEKSTVGGQAGLSTAASISSPKSSSGGVDPAGTMAADVPVDLLADDRYDQLRELGKGGMGVVYLARNKMMDRPEVLKVLGTQILNQPGAADRFLREIRSAAKLNHVNVVTAYSAIQVGSLFVFSMQYIEGENFAEIVRREGPMAVRDACQYLAQAASGLQHAHEHRMVHRDIKPANLMLSRDGGKPVVKILDFGLAKATSDGGLDATRDLTGAGRMLGTPDYIAPEQTLDAAHADIRADIYSLGCTMYFLLTGKPPFKANSLYELLKQHHDTIAKPLHERRTDVPPELSDFVARMMAKKPADRPQSPAEVIRALQGILKKPTGTSPSSPAIPKVPLPEIATKPATRTVSPQAAITQAADDEPWSAVSQSADRPMRKPRSQEKPKEASSSWLWPLLGGVGGLILLVGGLWLGGVFQSKPVEKPTGLLVVDIENQFNEFEITADGKKLELTRNGSSWETSMAPGRYEIEVRKSGYDPTRMPVVIEANQRKNLTLRLMATRRKPAEPPSEGPQAKSVARGPDPEPMPKTASPVTPPLKSQPLPMPTPTSPATPTPEQPVYLSEERMRHLLDRGIAYLRANQQPNGSWETKLPTPVDNFTGGCTSLVLLALLEAGVAPDDPAIMRGFQFLRAVVPTGSYSLSLQTQAFVRLKSPADAALIRRNVKLLEDGVAKETGGVFLGWGYTMFKAGQKPSADGSCSRYAIDGLHAAHVAGYPVKTAGFWQKIHDLYMRQKAPNGGWGYIHNLLPPATVSPSMSLSGALVLLHCRDCGVRVNAQSDDAIIKGYQRGTPKDLNSGKVGFPTYFADLLGLTTKAGLKQLQDKIAPFALAWVNFHDEIGKLQRPDGSIWDAKVNGTGDGYNPNSSTALALRFLSQNGMRKPIPK